MLRSYFPAIKSTLRDDSNCWDDDKAALSSLIKGCKLINDKVKVRLPIGRGLLELTLFELQ